MVEHGGHNPFVIVDNAISYTEVIAEESRIHYEPKWAHKPSVAANIVVAFKHVQSVVPLFSLSGRSRRFARTAPTCFG